MTVEKMLDVIREYVPEEMQGEILNELSHRKAEAPEYEGDRLNSWLVCPECHGVLNGRRFYCEWCGKKILND